VPNSFNGAQTSRLRPYVTAIYLIAEGPIYGSSGPVWGVGLLFCARTFLCPKQHVVVEPEAAYKKVVVKRWCRLLEAAELCTFCV
jgi:hypothetical protein